VKIRIPESYAPYLRIGTCSWKYDSWKGLYYENGKKYRPDDYLPDYANHLDTVEIDQWFWSLFPGGLRLPDPKTVKIYTESVPQEFVFTIKAPNSVTLTNYYSRQPKRHETFAGKPNPYFLDHDLFKRFLDSLAPMGDKIGPIMLQFEYLNRKKMPSRDAFLERLHGFLLKAPQGFLYAVEIRNPNYLCPAFFDFLEEHRLGHVFLEGYHMPHIGGVFERFGSRISQAAIIRLHGGDRLEIEKITGEVWDQVVEPKPGGLRAAARIVRSNRRRGIRTFVNVNNHYEGSAPVSIERFLEELRRQETA
jgi:uncharacterized protein YecE (DUF72 family)